MGALQDVTDWLSEPTRRGRSRAALQGLTFGFGDELESKLSGVPVEDIRKDIRKYGQDNPWENILYELVGGLPSGAGVSKLLTKIPEGVKLLNTLRTTPGNIGSVAKEGAIQSGLYGAGSGEGDLIERAKNAGIQAAQGAVAAPVIVGAGKALRNTGSAVRNIVTGGNPEKEAATAVKRALDSDLPKGLSEAIPISREQDTLLSKMGVSRQPMVVDVGGKNVDSLLRSASGTSGEAATVSADIAESTKGDIKHWLESILRTAVFDPTHPHHTSLKNIAQTRKDAVEPLYQQAFANKTGLLNSDLLGIAERLKMDPEVFTEALKQAQRSGRTYPTQWVPDSDITGKLTTGKSRPIGKTGFSEHEVIDPDLQFWDMVKRSIYQREAGGGTDPITLGKIRKELMGILDNHPDVDDVYKQARKLYTDESDVLKATEAGGNWHRLRPDQVEEQLANMSSQAEKEAFLSGVVNNILERSSKTDNSVRGAVKTLLGPEGQEKVGKLVSDPAEFEDMKRALELTAKFGSTADVMSRPSGVRLGSDAALQEALQASGAAAGALSGVGGSSLMNALSRAMKGHSASTDEEIKSLIMRYLTDNPDYAIPEIERLTQPGALDKIRSVLEKSTPAATGVAVGLEEPRYSPEP